MLAVLDKAASNMTVTESWGSKQKSVFLVDTPHGGTNQVQHHLFMEDVDFV